MNYKNNLLTLLKKQKKENKSFGTCFAIAAGDFDWGEISKEHIMSATLWLNPDYSNSDIEYIKQYLKKGDTYVDIGANIGHLALAASNLVGTNGTTIAVEGNKRIVGG